MSDVGPLDRHYAYPLVTWGSTFLGAVVALVTAFMLNVLGAALGVAAVAIVPSAHSAAISGVIGMLWVAIANLVALGFGAWVAGRSTANPDHHGGTMQGIAVWAVTSVAILFIAGSALAGIGNATMRTADMVAGADPSALGQGDGGLSGQPPATGQYPGASQAPATAQGDATAQQEDAAALQAAATKAAAATASAAFGTFLAMVLGLVAAIFGARAGARHPNWMDRPRFTYVERRH